MKILNANEPEFGGPMIEDEVRNFICIINDQTVTSCSDSIHK
jgi:hypothetical protein